MPRARCFGNGLREVSARVAACSFRGRGALLDRLEKEQPYIYKALKLHYDLDYLRTGPQPPAIIVMPCAGDLHAFNAAQSPN